MGATVKARIQLKYDTEAHWELARRFVPLRGEVIIYSPDDTRRFCRLKVGDGTTPVVDLPFISAENSAYVTSHTTAYWTTNATYIPNEGELIVYSDGGPAMKIGDGTTYVADLPFVNGSFMEHINNAAIHISSADRNFWNNKINCEDTVEQETLILNRS